MEPITRQEIFLASAAGESTQDLKPITRLEHFLKNVADHVKSIGNGGGGGVSITDDGNGNVTITSTNTLPEWDGGNY